MTKRQLIDEIVSLNSTAQPAFLARFEDLDLNEYLQHLRNARTPRLSGDPRRYDKYFNTGRRDASYPPASYGMGASTTTEADSDERAALLGKPLATVQAQTQADPEMEEPAAETAAELETSEVEGRPMTAEPQDQAEMDEIPAAVATALDEFDDDTIFNAPHEHVDEQDDFVGVDTQDEEDVEPDFQDEVAADDEAETETIDEAPAAEAVAPENVVAENAVTEQASVIAEDPQPAAEAAAEAPAEDSAPATQEEQPSAPKPFAEAQEDSQSWLF